MDAVVRRTEPELQAADCGNRMIRGTRPDTDSRRSDAGVIAGDPVNHLQDILEARQSVLGD